MIVHIPDEALERIPVVELAKLAAKHGCQVESRWKGGELSLIIVPRWKDLPSESSAS
jgi:hypothetical protein